MKKIFSLLLMTLMLVCFASCGGNNGSNKDVENIKKIFESMDGWTFNRNGYTIDLMQKYNIESHIDNEEEKTDYLYEYEGVGQFTILIDNVDYDAKDISEVLLKDNGYIDVHQYENIHYDCEEFIKNDNETFVEEYKHEITQNFIIKSYDNNLYVSGYSKFNDMFNRVTRYDNSFYGIINKELFDENVSTNFISNLFSELMIMDGYTNINSMEDVPVGNSEYSSKQIKKLMDDGTLSIEYKEDSSVINLNMNFKEFINIATETTDAKDAFVNIKMEFTNDDYEIIYLEYDLKDFFNEMLEVIDDDDEITNTIEEFLISATKFDRQISEIEMFGNFTTYNDPEEFIDDLTTNLAPLANPLDDNVIPN